MSDPLSRVLHGMWSAAAPAWGRHAGYADARGAVVTEAMLQAADLRSGARVLELACGPGGAGLAAAEIVGPDGEVVLSDVVPEMTAIAAERAASRGLTNVTTAEIDMENVDFPDGSFDAVLCREGLMLVVDPGSAAREAHRVLVPRGRAVYAVWGPRDKNPWLGILLDKITSRLGVPVPPPGIPHPFELSGDRDLERLLIATGFDDVRVREVETPMTAASFDQWWSVVPSLAGPVGPLLAAQPADVIAALRADIEAAFDEFRTQSGAFELPGLSLVGSGRH